MWKRQGYGKLFELPTTLWIPLCGTHFPTFSSLIPDYLKSNVRKILDTTGFSNGSIRNSLIAKPVGRIHSIGKFEK